MPISNPIPPRPSLRHRCQIVAGLIYVPTVSIECAIKGVAAILNTEKAPLTPCLGCAEESSPEVVIPHKLLSEGNGNKIRAHLVQQLESITKDHPEYRDTLFRVKNIHWEDAHIMGEFYGDLGLT